MPYDLQKPLPAAEPDMPQAPQLQAPQAPGLLDAFAASARGQNVEDVLRQRAADQNALATKQFELNKDQQALNANSAAAQRLQKLQDPTSDISMHMRNVMKQSVSSMAQAAGLDPRTVKLDYLDSMSGEDVAKQNPLDLAKLGLERFKLDQEKQKTAASAAEKKAADRAAAYKDATKQVVDTAKSVVAGNRGLMQTIGRAAKRVDDADNILGLIKSTRDKNGIVPTQQLGTELSMAVASLAANGNAVAQETVKRLYPHTAFGDFKNAVQYVTGQPQRAIPDAMISQIEHSAQREKELWTNKKQQYGKSFREAIKPYTDQFPDLEKVYDNTIAASVGDTSLEGMAPAPHGQVVHQDGKTYHWDGTQYVEGE